MAARIRTHDWAATPLGPLDAWPQSLRTAVDMILAMPGPANILWGPAHVQLYNDAYIAIARERHPALLGRPAAEGWPEIHAEVLAPVMDAAFAGRATRIADLSVQLQGPDGRPEERAFDTTWSPIRDETGAVGGALEILVEVTDRRRARAALRESEARHRLLIERFAQAVWETDADGVVVADSPSWRAYTGQTPEEWLGYGWLDAIHPDDRAYAERQWREAVAAHGLVNAEFRLRAPDGGWRWTNVRAAPVLDQAGRIEKWAGMNIDIDAGKRAEAALRESEEKYRFLFEFMDEAYAVVEVIKDEAGQWADFRFLDANRAFVDHTSMPHPVGRTATELLGSPNPRWTELYGRTLDTGEPIRVEETEPTLGRTFDLNIFTLDRERSRVAVLFTNITARKKAEAGLRASEDQLRLVTDAMPALISYVDAGLHYRFSNKRYREWFGRTSEEINGRHVRELLGDAALERIRPHAEVALAGRRHAFEAEVPFKLGGTRHVRTEFVPDVRADGSVAGYYSLAIDITDRKRMEEALRESKERRAFLLRLSDALRPIADPLAIQETASRMTAEHLDIGRVAYCEVRYEPDIVVVVERDWPRRGMPSIGSGRYRMDDFGRFLAEELTAGRAAIVADAASDPRLSGAERDNWSAFEVAASCALPVMKEGRFVAYLVAQDNRRRDWTDREVALLREVSERTWASIERARAEERLRRNEERNAFLVQFSDAVRGLSDPALVARQACRILSHQLGTERTLWAVIDRDAREYVADWAFSADGTPVEPSHWPYDEREPFAGEHLAGRPVVYDDVARDPRIPDPVKAAMIARGLLAGIAVPVVAAGRLRAVLNTSQGSAPRRWLADEVAFVEALAQRAWGEIERARAASALRESEERFRATFEQAAVGIVQASLDARILLPNPGFCQIIGYDAEEAKRLTVRDITHPDDYDLDMAQAARVLAGEIGGYTIEKRYIRKDGAVVWVQMAASLVRDAAGEPSYALAVVQDISARKRAELDLRHANERFRLAEEAANGFVYEWDLWGGSATRSEGLARVLGYAPGEVAETAEAWFDLIHPDDRAATIAVASGAPGSGTSFAIEYRVRHKDGRHIWVLDRGLAVPDPAPGGRIVGSTVDITDRKHAETALRESEALLRQFGEASSDVLWIRSADTLQWEYLSPAYEAIYGMPVEEALAGETFDKWADLILEEDRERAVASIGRVREGERVTFEYRVRRPDGGLRWLRNTDFPMRGPDGEIERIGGVGQDVTELKRIEAALREEEGRLRTLMEGIPQLVWRSCDRGLWTWSSPQWQAFTGQTLEESHGQGWLDAVHPDDREATLQAWEAAQPHGLLDVEYRVRRASDGADLWHHTRSVPVRDEAGRIVEWLGTSTDVQQLKELQERQAVMVAELQHRTRNLIAVVRSIATQTMALTGPTEAFRDEFNHRLEALARVQGLLSRAEAEPITIEALIRLELDALAGLDGARDRIRLDGPPVRLRNSIVQTLALALHELATNARKYGALSRDGGRLGVTWRVREADGEGRRLAVDWVEEGIGRRPEQTSPAGGGYGRELIERALPYALGATTAYELRPEGVRCTIDLPLERRDRRSRTPR